MVATLDRLGLERIGLEPQDSTAIAEIRSAEARSVAVHSLFGDLSD